MTRRSNSLLPIHLPSDRDDSSEKRAIAPSSGGDRAFRHAAEAANAAASRYVFADYSERVSPATHRRHAAGLTSFAAYLRDAGVAIEEQALMENPAAWQHVTWGLVKGYVRWLLQDGYAIRTINARLSTVKIYSRLAHQAGVLDSEQNSRIQLVKGYGRKQGKHTNDERRKHDIPTRVGAKKREPTPIPDHVARHLKLQPNTPQGRRDALLMCLLLDHGLRCSEVADLRVEHFDLSTGTFTFYRRKVDLTQTHRMTRDTRHAVEAYLVQDAQDAGPLLRASTKHGTLHRSGMTTRAITKRVRRLGRALGIAKLSAHDCRHYWATRAVRHGTHVKDLQEAGGWASPIMPLQYAKAAEVSNEGVNLGDDADN